MPRAFFALDILMDLDENCANKCTLAFLGRFQLFGRNDIYRYICLIYTSWTKISHISKDNLRRGGQLGKGFF